MATSNIPTGALVRREINFVDTQYQILEDNKRRYGYSTMSNFTRYIIQRFIEDNKLQPAQDKKKETP